MVKKIIGYLVAAVGILGVATTVIPELRTAMELNSVDDSIIVISSVILVLIGIILSLKGGRKGRQAKEVPIYKGKNVVGYRQH